MSKAILGITLLAGMASAASAVAPVPSKLGQATPPSSIAHAPQPVARAQFLANIDANFRTLDTNHDGVITLDEIVAAQAKQGKILEAQAIKRRADVFAKLDTNRDGTLSAAEFNAGFPLNPPPLPDPKNSFGKLDANKDGKITADEFRSPQIDKFNQIDTNHDGVITVQEVQAFRRTSK